MDRDRRMNGADDRPYYTRNSAGTLRIGMEVCIAFAYYGFPRATVVRCIVLDLRASGWAGTGVQVRMLPVEAVPKRFERDLVPEEWFDASWVFPWDNRVSEPVSIGGDSQTLVRMRVRGAGPEQAEIFS